MPARLLILSVAAVGFAMVVGLISYFATDDVEFGLLAFALIGVIVAAAIWR